MVSAYKTNDLKPYIYKTVNYGKSWELITTETNGIPNDFTTRVVREDPVREGLLYVGTESGLFVSFNEGKSWNKFQQNLPVTPITDIKIFRGDLVLSTMGRSFWILDNITTLRQPEINSLNNNPWLFKPDTTIRYRYPKVRTASNAFPKYPQTSVAIDYFIPNGNTNGIELTILNESKEPIISFISDKSLLKSTDTVIENMDLNKLMIPLRLVHYFHQIRGCICYNKGMPGKVESG